MPKIKTRNPSDATVNRNIRPVTRRVRELEQHRRRIDAVLRQLLKAIPTKARR